MPVSTLSESDVARAKQLWADYQKRHDISRRIGQAVGIDPVSGRIWFGDSATDIRLQMDEEGIEAALLVLRVGSGYYLRKGGRR